MSAQSIDPQVHPTHLRFSVWDRADHIQVAADQTIIIGRDEQDVTVDLSIHHGRLLGVSRRHAEVMLTPDGVGIRDLDSAHGTSVNGDPLMGEKVYPLQHGDELQFGGLYVTVYFDYDR